MFKIAVFCGVVSLSICSLSPAEQGSQLESTEGKKKLAVSLDQVSSEQLAQFLTSLKNLPKNSDDEQKEKEKEKVLEKAQQSSQKFYEEYLAKYYPKALVIRGDFFTSQDPSKVAGALAAFVDLLSKTPWFYVSNKPEGFKLTCYWEFIIDQCALINAYIKKAYVNPETNTVYIPYSSYGSSAAWSGAHSRPSTRLLDYFKEFHNEVLGAFYAFSFDYVIKLFNEGILLKDFNKTLRYVADLEFIIEKLQNTPYEAEYQEFMKIVKELVALFKQKRNVDNAEMLDRLYGNDEKSKQYAQESMMLNSRY